MAGAHAMLTSVISFELGGAPLACSETPKSGSFEVKAPTLLLLKLDPHI